MKTYREFITEAKRMRVLRTAHYTKPEHKEKILQHGFGPSRSGKYHPRDTENTVYTTPSSRIGKDYGKSRVNLKLINPKIHKTAPRKDYFDKYQQASETERRKMKVPDEHSKELISRGAKVVKVPDAHHTERVKGSYVMVDKNLANRSISKNAPPTIRAKDKPQRTKTQPKKK